MTNKVLPWKEIFSRIIPVSGYLKKIFMEREIETIEQFYDYYADRYSKNRTEKGLLFNEYIEQPAFFRLIEKDSTINSGLVLDIGCGPGIYTKELAQRGSKLVSIDVSKKMLDQAKSYCKKQLNDSVFEDIDFQHISFENYQSNGKRFNLILATFMLSYFPDLQSFFTKISSILSTNGIVVASILHPVRMAAIKENNGYSVSNYFDDGYYESDFISHSNKIKLKKWRIEQISCAAHKAGLVIEQIFEPTPQDDLPDEYLKVAEFYKNNPSILMLRLRLA